MKKNPVEEKPVTLEIRVDPELDKRNIRVSQLKMDRANEILKKFPPPDLHSINEPG